MVSAHVRHRRRRPRSRNEMRAAIEARIREQDRLDDETTARLREALAVPDVHRWGAHARPTSTRTLAAWLLRRVTRRPVDYPKEQR